MTTDNPKVSKPRHNSAPWTDELSPLIEPGDDRVRLGQLQVPPSTACRILAEENFQFAKECVNEVARLRQERDELVGALGSVLPIASRMQAACDKGDVLNFDNEYDAADAIEYARVIAEARAILSKHKPE